MDKAIKKPLFPNFHLSKIFGKNEPEEVVQAQEAQTRIDTMGKDLAEYILEFVAVPKESLDVTAKFTNDPVVRKISTMLFAEEKKGRIAQFMQYVEAFHPEKLPSLLQCIVYYMHALVDHTLAEENTDKRFLTRIIDSIFVFAEIADPYPTSLQAQLQDAAVLRMKDSVQKAAELEYMELCQKEPEVARTFPDDIEVYEICRRMQLKKFLVANTQITYRPKTV